MNEKIKCNALVSLKNPVLSLEYPALVHCDKEATLEVKTKYFDWYDPLCDECYEKMKDLKYIKPETMRRIKQD